MALRCFYVVDGEPVGPVSAEELFRLGRAGKFPGETLVWIERTADWQAFAPWAAGFEAENPRVVAPQPPARSESPAPKRDPSASSAPIPSLPAERIRRTEPTDPRKGGWYRNISRTSILVAVASIIVICCLGVVTLRRFFLPTPTGADTLAAPSREPVGTKAIAPSKPMSPVKSVPGASRITHPTLNFSFDIPAGFVEFPSNTSTLKLWKVYGRPAGPGELSEIFGIQPLGSTLPRRHLELKDIPAEKHATISRVSWRGTMVDAFRFTEAANGMNYVSYNVQIPLKGEAIQLMFGAPMEREAELKSRVETLLASLDGLSDW